ncbi:hypothetical protein KR044_002279, partial [Drosophila immigrans]
MRSGPLRLLSGKCSTHLCLKRLSTKAFNTPRPPKDPPDEGYQPQSVDHEDIDPPDFVRPEVFRQFEPNEVLGPGAGISKGYKNTQYFGYHRFSYVELQNHSMELRDERRLSGGVQAHMGEEDEDECPDDSLDAIKALEAECDEALKAQMKDEEKDTLKAWCTLMEKKQEEIREVKKCEDSEKQKLQACKTIEKVEKIIDKGAKKIVEECVQKMEKSAAAGKCKEAVIKEALAELETECKNLTDPTPKEKGKVAEKSECKEEKKADDKCENSQDKEK